MKIYDENGYEISIERVIFNYIQEQSDIHGEDMEFVYVGGYTFGGDNLEIFVSEDNGYDGLNLMRLGETIKVE